MNSPSPRASAASRVFTAGGACTILLAAVCVTARPAAAADGLTAVEGATPVVYKRLGETELRLHIFQPQGGARDAPQPAIVFFFGGGWSSGTPRQFAPQARHLAERGMVACCAEYRISGLHHSTVADAVADARSAVRYLRQHAEELRIDPARIAAGGGSAGGHIAAAATLEGLDDPQDDATISCRPDALLLFNPALDLVEFVGRAGRIDSVRDLAQRLGGDAAALSPSAHIVAGLPPTIMFHGTSDTVVPFQQSADFAKRSRDAGNRCEVVPYDGGTHGFFNADRGSERDYQDTLRRGDEFLVSLGWLKAPPPGESP